MTQAYSRREDELVASCVTVIYIYTTFFVLWFAFISIYTYKLCLQSYNLFLFDSMNMLECTKVSVCILYVQYFATSLATYADMIVERRCLLEAQLGSRCPESLDWSFEMI